jgi:hypothetical protein
MLQKQEKQRVRSIRQFDGAVTVHSFGECYEVCCIGVGC